MAKCFMLFNFLVVVLFCCPCSFTLMDNRLGCFLVFSRDKILIFFC